MKPAANGTALRRLYLSFGAMVFLLLLLVSIAFQNFRQLEDVNHVNQHSYQTRNKVQELFISLINMETGARGFRLTGKKSFLQPYEDGEREFAIKMREALILSREFPPVRDKLRELAVAEKTWKRSIDASILSRSRTRGEYDITSQMVDASVNRKRMMDRMRAIVDSIFETEDEVLRRTAEHERHLRMWTTASLVSGALFAVLLAIGLSTQLARTTGEVLRSNQQLVSEVAEREKAERTLRASEERFRLVAQSITDAIISATVDGQIIFWNDGAQRIFGYQENEVYGRHLSMLLPEKWHDDQRQRLAALKADERATVVRTNIQLEGRHKDGSEFPVELSLTRWRVGQAQFVTGIIRDITERTKIDRMKNEFISTVSHELRTPLTSIRGALGLVAGGVAGEVPARALEMIEIAHKNSERLVRLINDILDIEKIESGKMELKSEALAIVPLVEQALEANRAYASEFDVSLRLTSRVTATTQVMGGYDHLMQVLTNLLSNAAKFSPHGGSVAVEVERQESMIRVSITNHGSGIPREFRDRIFEKFAQADGSDARKKGGTGLGLSISKAIVERLGGQIGFESDNDSTTTFYFELPEVEPAPGSSQVPSAEVREQTQQNAATEVAPTAETPIAPSILPVAAMAEGFGVSSNGRARILVCEDDRDVATLLRMLLRQSGFAVDVAHNAGDARSFLAREHYCGMTVDIALPDSDGLSFIRDLRADPATRELPVVVVSASAKSGLLDIQGDAVGIEDWLTKPIDGERLLAAVRRASRQHANDVATMKPRILHVEDESDVVRVIAEMLQELAVTRHAASLEEARAALEAENFDLIILDLGLPDGNGTRLLSWLQDRKPPTPVLVFSASDIDSDVAEYVSAALTKSRTSNQKLVDTIKTLLGATDQRE